MHCTVCNALQLHKCNEIIAVRLLCRVALSGPLSSASSNGATKLKTKRANRRKWEEDEQQCICVGVRLAKTVFDINCLKITQSRRTNGKRILATRKPIPGGADGGSI